jgi:hypothetical protein
MEEELKSVPADLDQYVSQVWETVKDYDLTAIDGKKLFLKSILCEIHNGAKMQKYMYDNHQEIIEKIMDILQETAKTTVIIKDRFQEIEKLLFAHQDCLTTLMKK